MKGAGLLVGRVVLVVLVVAAGGFVLFNDQVPSLGGDAVTESEGDMLASAQTRAEVEDGFYQTL